MCTFFVWFRFDHSLGAVKKTTWRMPCVIADRERESDKRNPAVMNNISVTMITLRIQWLKYVAQMRTMNRTKFFCTLEMHNLARKRKKNQMFVSIHTIFEVGCPREKKMPAEYMYVWVLWVIFFSSLLFMRFNYLPEIANLIIQKWIKKKKKKMPIQRFKFMTKFFFSHFWSNLKMQNKKKLNNDNFNDFCFCLFLLL